MLPKVSLSGCQSKRDSHASMRAQSGELTNSGTFAADAYFSGQLPGIFNHHQRHY